MIGYLLYLYIGIFVDVMEWVLVVVFVGCR